MHYEDEVRLIAYQLWEGEGYPDGRHLEHWFKAEAIWQGKQGQIAHVAEDLPSRADLVTPRTRVQRKRAQSRPRRSQR